MTAVAWVAAVAQVQSLAWELPCAVGVALKSNNKKKNQKTTHQSRILYPEKLSFKSEG